MNINKNALLLSSLLLSTSVFSGTESALEIINKSISSHHKVVSSKYQIESRVINMLDIQSQNSIKIDFSAKSNLPVTSNTDPLGRNSSLTDGFLDGYFTASTPLYDGGMSDYAYKAENEYKSVSKLEESEERENILYRLLSLANKADFLSESVVYMEESRENLSKSIKELRLRFTAGIGTLTDVREIQLDKLDIENEIQGALTERKTIESIMKKEFKVKQGNISTLAYFSRNLSDKTIKNRTGLSCLSGSNSKSIAMKRSQRISEHNFTAHKFNINKLSANNRPHVRGELSAVIHDMDKGFDEYSVFAGISIDFSLFDGGASKVEERKEKQRMKANELEYTAKKVQKENAFEETQLKCLNLKSREEILLAKKEKLERKIKDETLRLSILKANPTQKIKAQFLLSKLEREVESIRNTYVELNLNYLKLNESLLELIK
jgi:outer membrane protein TolC